jgi:hypothetical protein
VGAAAVSGGSAGARAATAALTPPLRRVRPEEGRPVLFPSYFFHRTTPFDADGTRVSLAFDVTSL